MSPWLVVLRTRKPRLLPSPLALVTLLMPCFTCSRMTLAAKLIKTIHSVPLYSFPFDPCHSGSCSSQHLPCCECFIDDLYILTDLAFSFNHGDQSPNAHPQFQRWGSPPYPICPSRIHTPMLEYLGSVFRAIGEDITDLSPVRLRYIVVEKSFPAGHYSLCAPTRQYFCRMPRYQGALKWKSNAGYRC